MRKIINTLRYGKAKTKTFIISVFVLMVAAIVIGIIGINGMNIILLGISMVLFIICIIMVFKLESATADVDADDPSEPESVTGTGTERTTARSAAGADVGKFSPKSAAGADAGRSAPRSEADDAGDLRGANSEEKRKVVEEKPGKTLRAKTRGPRAVRAQLEKRLLVEIIKANKRSAILDRKTYGKRMKEAVKARDRQIQEIVPERGRNTEQETVRVERERSSERGHGVERKTDYKSYTKNEIKRLRKIYKIPKDACKIIIDSCKSLAIDHAPAFFWVKKGRIYILAFEESARCETLPMSKMKVSYKKNLREDEIIKYNSMREMGVYKDFEDMMPTFSIHGGAAGNEYFKNLYVLGKDLEVTPRSLRSLMTQFDFEIQIFDSLGIKGNYSKYFKNAYEQRIMWTDGVISQNQYQNNIRDILQSMVDDDSIIRYDFMDDLAKMVHHRLITDEYAEYYKNKRL